MEVLQLSIIKAGQNKNHDDLERIIAKTNTKKLVDAAIQKVGRADANIFWNFLLTGFKNTDLDGEKRFTIIMAVLQQMNKVEIHAKQCFEMITRLYIELPKMKNSQLIDLCEYCIDSIRMGDPKCVGWKDLFPELLSLITTIPRIIVNGTAMTGEEYKDQLIQTNLSQRWANSILTVIAGMFREIELTKETRSRVINKICDPILKLEPTEIPALAYQLISLCKSAALVLIPLYAFNQYFHRHCYKKIYADMDSDQSNYDSIEPYSDKELFEAQDTILFHLSNCAELNFTEKDVIGHLRGLASNPRYILTPFMISALLTMCKINRDLDSARLSSSVTLQFLRSVIRNNEREHDLCKHSSWCRLTLDESVINLEKIYSVLIDQSKEGTDYVTPGIIALLFILLKSSHSQQLNALGIKSLEQFVKKRYIFGPGIIKKLKEFLFADMEAQQFSDCLTRLSKSCSLTLVDSVESFEEILDFFLLIPGNHAMQMMAFITPLIQISHRLRDYLIDILRKAMYQGDLSTRQLSVFGFCQILKQLRHNNSRRISAGLGGSQLTISGYSLTSQSILDHTRPAQRHFDILAFEIMGMLRKSFNETYELKEVLYENLTSAVDGNLNLTPHIIQLLELKCRTYFQVNDTQFVINFDKIISECSEGSTEVQVYESLGKLIKCVGHCITVCDQGGLEFDTSSLRSFFKVLINRIHVAKDSLEIIGSPSIRTNHLVGQYLNVLEALIYYIFKSNSDEEHPLTAILSLFTIHVDIRDQMKQQQHQTKKVAKRKANVTGVITTQLAKQMSIIGTFKPDNIWTLGEVYQILMIINGESEKFTPDQINCLRNDDAFGEYVLSVATEKVIQMNTAPSYKQIKYSKSHFSTLCKITNVTLKLYTSNIVNYLDKGKSNLACLSVECLYHCFNSAQDLYKRKFQEFLKLIDITGSRDFKLSSVPLKIQGIIDVLIARHDDKCDDITLLLLQCLEILYTFTSTEEDDARMNYNWLIEFCKKNELKSDKLGIIHKLLFSQRVRSHTGTFFDGIAMQIGESVGLIQTESMEIQFKLKSITQETATSCTLYLCAILKKEIEDVEYFIMKCKSFHMKYKIGGQGEQHGNKCVLLMKTTERKVCLQLINIGRACKYLANACIPLGNCMDALIKLLIQLYVCMANLTKHLIIRNATIAVSHNQTKFDELVRALGKSLPLRIYGLIRFIEENVFYDREKSHKSSGQGSKAKVVRETKYIPKLIMRIENFNKFVVALDKKSKSQDLASRLHLGTVRDFRVQTAALREAINKTIQDSQSPTDIVEDLLNGDDDTNGDDDEANASGSDEASEAAEDNTI